MRYVLCEGWSSDEVCSLITSGDGRNGLSKAWNMSVLGGVGESARAVIAPPCTGLPGPAPIEGWGATNVASHDASNHGVSDTDE